MKSNWQAGQTGHIAEHNEIARRLVNVADYDSIQAAINAAKSSGCRRLVFPSVGGYSVSDGEVVIEPKQGETQIMLDLICLDPVGIAYAGVNQAILTRGWKNSHIDGMNIALFGNGGVGWDITDPVGAGSSGGLNFNNCVVGLYGQNNIGFRGGALDSAGTDISCLNFNNCTIGGNDSANGHKGYVICHPNCLVWNWFGGGGFNLNTFAEAIQWDDHGAGGGGSMMFYGLANSHNLLEFRPWHSGPWSIFAGRFEVGKRFLECGQIDGGNGYPMAISVIGAEISQYTPADGVLFEIGTAGSLLLDNATITYSDVETNWTADMVRLGGWVDGYGSLVVRGGSVKASADPFYSVVQGNWSVRVEDVSKVDARGYVVGKYLNRE